MKLFILIGGLLVSSFAFSRQDELSGTFVNLFEWKWTTIARECQQFLGPHGYSAVQVSPPNEHIVVKNSPWYQRYQPVSYKLQSQSGTESEFRQMVKACNAAGVAVYVDAVINHMSGVNSDTPDFRGSAGSAYGHYIYPDVYSYEDFHHCGLNDGDEIRNFSDRFEVQNCELGNLADLKTESPEVQQTLYQYLKKLVDMGVAGFRMDAAKHIPVKDLDQIFGDLKQKVFIYQEVIGSDQEEVQAKEYLKTGNVTEFKYLYHVGSFFLEGKISWFNNNNPLGEMWGYLPSSQSVVFIDNHDSQRTPGLLSHKLKEKYKLANVFMLAWPYGYPQVMSSYQFENAASGPPDSAVCTDGWVCEHRWKYISSMVKFRKATALSPEITNWWSNDNNQIAFGRGSAGFVVINNESTDLKRVFKTAMPPGSYCNILATGGCSLNQIKTSHNGEITVSLSPYQALAIYKESSR